MSMLPSFTLTCESDFLVLGLQEGERHITPVRIAATFFTLTITSAWTLWKIKRLSLFFAQWLSGLVMCLFYMLDEMMVILCWTSRNLEVFIKTIKFFELAASNMFAITNLAVCVNLALIVQSHRTMTRVRSVTSPPVILLFLAISMGLAGASIPFWDVVVVFGTSFGLLSFDEARLEIINVSVFYIEFVVGVCMLLIVVWLLLFRMKEIKDCWALHHGIRFYFVLTIIGTVVNLGLGICGTIFVGGGSTDVLLMSSSWMCRYIHIALDTFVLYGILGERSVDQRGDGARLEGARSGSDASSCGPPTATHKRGGSGGSNMKIAPLV